MGRIGVDCWTGDQGVIHQVNSEVIIFHNMDTNNKIAIY